MTATDTDTDFYVTTDEAASLLGVTASSVRRRCQLGQLPALRDRVSRRYRIVRSAVLAQLEPVRPPPPAALIPLSGRARATLERHGLL